MSVVSIALREVGVSEHPPGSNSGPRVRQYQAATDLGGTGWPWCAAFVEWCWKAAGLDTSICSPSTQTFADRARALGATGSPRPGAAFIIPGTHTGLLVASAGGNIWHTVEGNSGDAVSRRVRDLSGTYIAFPRGLAAGPARRMLYWFDDPGAKATQRLLGPWKGKRGLAAARKAAAARPRWEQPRVKRVGPDRFGVLIGQRSTYGPWEDATARDAALRVIRKRTGRTLRPYSSPMSRERVAADALGKTT